MENQGRVSSALKRLIAYVSSYTTGCQYCQAHAIRAAERYGAGEDQLQHIWEYKSHPAFSPGERAALDFAIAASSVPNAVDEPIANQLKQYWSKRLPGGNKCLKQVTSGTFYQLVPDIGGLEGPEPKYYINNPSSLIETAVSSGGVEVINQINHTVRLSISPSQGDDPGFKSRPEQLLLYRIRKSGNSLHIFLTFCQNNRGTITIVIILQWYFHLTCGHNKNLMNIKIKPS